MQREGGNRYAIYRVARVAQSGGLTGRRSTVPGCARERRILCGAISTTVVDVNLQGGEQTSSIGSIGPVWRGDLAVVHNGEVWRMRYTSLAEAKAVE